MGQQGEVIGFDRRVEEGAQVAFTKVDAGGGDVEEAQHLDSPGEDTQPLPGDFCSFEALGKSGTKHATGYHDAKTEQKAGPGEHRTYARDSSGNTVVEMWLQSGKLHIEVFKQDVPIEIKTPGPVVIDSPDVSIGPGGGGRGVACVGDLGVGSVRALCGAPGSPIIPIGATPTPSGGVPLGVQIVSGRVAVKAGDG